MEDPQKSLVHPRQHFEALVGQNLHVLCASWMIRSTPSRLMFGSDSGLLLWTRCKRYGTTSQPCVDSSVFPQPCRVRSRVTQDVVASLGRLRLPVRTFLEAGKTRETPTLPSTETVYLLGQEVSSPPKNHPIPIHSMYGIYAAPLTPLDWHHPN